jgi:uncharacterized protein (DUF1810 family)
MSASDPFHLARFVAAQAPVLDAVRRELTNGRKTSHWMWFVFPQLAGLGHSAMARRYAIGSLAEARAYLDHPLLGPRLAELTALVDALPDPDPVRVFGQVDAQKLRSYLTLFDAARPHDLFARALEVLFAGETDGATLARLAADGSA